jgi:hypothetical protein
MITTCSTIEGNDDHRRREEGDRRAGRGTDSVVYGNSDHAETNIGIGQKGWRPKKHNDEIVGFLLSRTGSRPPGCYIETANCMRVSSQRALLRRRYPDFLGGTARCSTPHCGLRRCTRSDTCLRDLKIAVAHSDVVSYCVARIGSGCNRVPPTCRPCTL